MSKCTYKYQDRSTCHRDAMPDRSLCILHEDFDYKDSEQTNIAFQEELDSGIVSFEGFRLFNIEIKNHTFQEDVVFFDITIRGSLKLENIQCDTIDFTKITIEDNFFIKDTEDLFPKGKLIFDDISVRRLVIVQTKIEHLIVKKLVTIKRGFFKIDDSEIVDIDIYESQVHNCRLYCSLLTNLSIKDCIFLEKTRFYNSQEDLLEWFCQNSQFETFVCEKYTFINKFSFQDTRFRNACLCDLNFKSSECSFEKCTFDGKVGFLSCTFGDYLSFKDSTFSDLKVQEDVARQAKTVLDHSGYHELADIHHRMEMRARRKQKNAFIQFFEWFVFDLICGYGIRFIGIIIAWLILIFGYGFLYRFIPDVIHESDSYTGNFREALYFSVVTATTLGYGDLQPVGWGRLIAASEAMLGMLFWTLLLVVIARKYMRS